MESTHSQPLLRKNSIDTDVENFAQENSTTDNLAEDSYHGTINAPNDKYNFSYTVFYLLGMTTLLPWNFFLTAEEYWLYKFRDVFSNSTNGLTPLQSSFISNLTVSAAVPNTLFLILNAVFGHKIALKYRMVGSLAFVLMFFIVTTVLVEVNTDSWQKEFFVFSLSSVVMINMAAATLSSALYGISSLFPCEYVTAVSGGQALGGVFAALCEIMSLSIGTSAETTALIYFMIGNMVLLVSIIAYVIVSKTAFFKHYTIDNLIAPPSVAVTPSSFTDTLHTPNVIVVLRKMWINGVAECIVFVVSLCIYPSCTVLISSQYRPRNNIYFVPVVNFLIFNSGDYLGRILSGIIAWPHNRPLLVAALSLLRVVFVPAFFFCGLRPIHNLPGIIHADYVFIILMCLFSLSNGYLANVAFICMPNTVENYEKEMASSIMAAFLGIGLAIGSSIGLLLVQLL